MVKKTEKVDSEKAAKQKAAYEKKKATARAQSQEEAKQGAEIGPLPEVVNHARRESCRHNLKLFIETYLPSMFENIEKDWATFHLESFETLQQTFLEGGMFAVALPRGSGKSCMTAAACIWAACYGHKHFVVIICATDDLAVGFMTDIKSQLEEQELLNEDFPEVCYPIRQLEGKPQRCASQTVDGVRTKIEWTKNHIVLPNIAKYASSGFRIATGGITGSKIRGVRFTLPGGRVIRPDVVVLDDPQDDESARSVEQTKTRMSLIRGAIMKMKGPGKSMALIACVTVIRKGDVADQLLQTPDWQGIRYGVLDRIPGREAMELWNQYRRIQEESFAQKRGRSMEVDFYLKHQSVMDDGIVATWQGRFDAKTERSAIQAAMNEYFQGEKEFFAELMNNPNDLDEGDTYKLDPLAVRNRLTMLPRFEVPMGFDFLTVGTDVQKTLVYYAVMAWRMDFTGSVIDYGWFPGQNTRDFSLKKLSKTLQSASNATEADIDAAVSWGLMQLGKTVYERQYCNRQGFEIFIPTSQIDINYRETEDAVARFCALPRYKEKVTPAMGLAVLDNRKRISEWATKTGQLWPKPAERRQCEWMLTNPKKHGLRECQFDPNHWKTHVNMAMSLPLHSSGSISIYGERPEEHQMFSEHMTSHYSTFNEKAKQTQWLMRPGVSDDHLLDCIVGCCVAASRHGARLTRSTSAIPAEPKQTKQKRRIEIPEHMRVG